MTTIPTLAQDNLAPNAQALLCSRYYAKTGTHIITCPHCGGLHESHASFLKRISFNNSEYHRAISQGDFLPNSPTLFNAGVPDAGTLSACFFQEIQDSLLDGDASIMAVGTTAAAITKFGGGVGYYFGNLRPKGATIKSTHGKAMGPVAVLRYMDSVGRMISQAGKREAAQMGVLPHNHPDIREFITCKDENPDELSTFNISVSVTDDFMRKAMISGSAEEGLLHLMAQSCWTTGDPGIMFHDRVNRDNPMPWLGDIKGCNPCSEQMLHHNESCNLASANLMAHYDVKTGKIKWTKLAGTVGLMVKYLNDVIDYNSYPTPAIDAAAKYSRRIGVGYMGLADLLACQELQYDSDEARQLTADITRFIRVAADKATRYLGSMIGPAPCYRAKDRASYLLQRDSGVVKRNAIVTSIQPTGTTALLLGVSTGIEPFFALSNTRTTAEGVVFQERPLALDILDSRGRGSSFTPKIASDIAPEDHLQMVAAAQQHVDNGISKTINVDNDATVEDIIEVYKKAWIYGLKAVSVFRDGCRQKQVLSKCGDEACTIEGKEALLEELNIGVNLTPFEFVAAEEDAKRALDSLRQAFERVNEAIVSGVVRSRDYNGMVNKFNDLYNEFENIYNDDSVSLNHKYGVLFNELYAMRIRYAGAINVPLNEAMTELSNAIERESSRIGG